MIYFNYSAFSISPNEYVPITFVETILLETRRSIEEPQTNPTISNPIISNPIISNPTSSRNYEIDSKLIDLFVTLAQSTDSHLGIYRDAPYDITHLWQFFQQHHPNHDIAERVRSLRSTFTPYSLPTKPKFSFLLLFCEGHNWQHLLDAIASIQALYWRRPIIVVAWDATEDQLAHLELCSYVNLLHIPGHFKAEERDPPLFDAFELALSRFPTLFYLPTGRLLIEDQMCRWELDELPFISKNNPKTHIHRSSDIYDKLMKNKLFYRATADISIAKQLYSSKDRIEKSRNLDQQMHKRNQMIRPPNIDSAFFKAEDIYGPPLFCLLHMSPPPSDSHLLTQSFPAQPPLDPFIQSGKPTLCLAISTYNPDLTIDPRRFSLNSIVLASLMSVLTEATFQEIDLYVYLGIQAGDAWDDPTWRAQVLAEARRITEGRVRFRWFRYPLVGHLRDITFKYNQLIMQAYNDGCQYIYQFSDDASFTSLAKDWPLQLVADMKARSDFGTWGMYDTGNPGLMTLGASGRPHIELQGWFWPPILKNWLSDIFLMDVYGEEFSVWREDLKITNNKTYGMRYVGCPLKVELSLAVILARARAVLWALVHNPDKAAYFLQLVKEEYEALTSAWKPYVSPYTWSCFGRMAFRKITLSSASLDKLHILFATISNIFDSNLKVDSLKQPSRIVMNESSDISSFKIIDWIKS